MAKRKTPYRSKVKIGVDANGKDIVKYIQGYTRAELDQAREDVIARYITGEALAEDRMFGDYASEWYRVRKAPFISKSSQESYRTALNKDIFPAFGDRKLNAISALELQAFVNQYADKSATKITVIIATLKGIFKSAISDRLIRNDPTTHLIRPSAAAPAEKPSLTPEQRQAIEATCRARPDALLLALMYYLGVRPGEARGLQWGDIDWTASRVHIQRDIDYKDHGKAGALKTRASNRVVPVPQPLADLLRPARGLPDTYIAAGTDPYKPLAKTSSERLWADLMHASGLATPAPESTRYRDSDPRAHWIPTITPHTLRHNYITMCWEHGLDPYETMKLVGHTSITTTLNIYTHLSEAQMTKTALKIDEMFNNSAPKKEKYRV